MGCEGVRDGELMADLARREDGVTRRAHNLYLPRKLGTERSLRRDASREWTAIIVPPRRRPRWAAWRREIKIKDSGDRQIGHSECIL